MSVFEPIQDSEHLGPGEEQYQSLSSADGLYRSFCSRHLADLQWISHGHQRDP